MIDHRRYYRDLKIDFFTDDLCQMLRDIAQGLVRDSVIKPVQEMPWLQIPGKDTIALLYDLARDFTCNTDENLFFLQPNTSLVVHLDDTINHPYRLSTIAVPIYSRTAVSPTHWYDSLSSTVPCVTADQLFGRPKLLNVTEPHNVVNGAEWRCQAQISLDIPYDEAVKRIEQGILTRTFSCTLQD